MLFHKTSEWNKFFDASALRAVNDFLKPELLMFLMISLLSNHSAISLEYLTRRADSMVRLKNKLFYCVNDKDELEDIIKLCKVLENFIQSENQTSLEKNSGSYNIIGGSNIIPFVVNKISNNCNITYNLIPGMTVNNVVLEENPFKKFFMGITQQDKNSQNIIMLEINPSDKHYKASHIQEYMNLLESLQQKYIIVAQSFDEDKERNKIIESYNKQLKKVADSKKWQFIELGELSKDKSFIYKKFYHPGVLDKIINLAKKN
jgi:hypothetical protein